LRNQEVALREGNFRTLIAGDQKEIFAFQRTLHAESIIVVLNNGWTEQVMSLDVAAPCKDLLTGNIFLPDAGKISLKLNPKSGVLLKSQTK
jgi:glycosidase